MVKVVVAINVLNVHSQNTNKQVSMSYFGVYGFGSRLKTRHIVTVPLKRGGGAYCYCNVTMLNRMLFSLFVSLWNQ